MNLNWASVDSMFPNKVPHVLGAAENVLVSVLKTLCFYITTILPFTPYKSPRYVP